MLKNKLLVKIPFFELLLSLKERTAEINHKRQPGVVSKDRISRLLGVLCDIYGHCHHLDHIGTLDDGRSQGKASTNTNQFRAICGKV